MEKWVNPLLPICLLILCSQVIEGLPVQQVPSPSQQQDSEWDQCELPGLEDYEEQCGTKTVSLLLCNPGYKRVWWCVQGADGLPEGFDSIHDMCESCPRNTFQKMYNKCRVCHPCSVCDEGETVEKECERDSDTKCTPLNPEPTTRSLPPSAPPSKEAVYSLELSTAASLTDDSTPTTDQTDLPGEFPEGLPISTPYASNKWLYVCLAIIVALAVLLVIALIGWWREHLLRKKLQDNQEIIPLNEMPCNGDARHEGDRDRGLEERAPLLEDERQHEDAEAVQNAVDREAVQASGDPAVDDTTDNEFAEGRPDDAADEDAADVDAIGRSDSASDTATDDIDGGWSDGAHGCAADVPEAAEHPLVVDGTTDNEFAEGSPDDAADVDAIGGSGSAYDTATDDTDGGSSDGAHGSAADVAEDGVSIGAYDRGTGCAFEGTTTGSLGDSTKFHTSVDVTGRNGVTADGGKDDGTSASPRQVVAIPDETPTGASDGAAEHPLDQHTKEEATSRKVDGADVGALSSRGGLDFNISDENPVGVSDGASGAPPDDLTTLKDPSDVKDTSASGDSHTDGADGGGDANHSGLDIEDIADKATIDLNDRAKRVTGGDHATPDAAPDELATNASSDGNSCTDGTCTNKSNNASVHPSGFAADHQLDGASVHPSNGASGPPSGDASLHLTGGASLHLSGGASVHLTGGASHHPSGDAFGRPSGGASLLVSGGASVRISGGASLHLTGGASGDPSGASGHPSDGASCHPSGGASGHPSGGASGHPSDGASGHPSDGASGHPSDGASGRPSDSASGRPSGGASGHPSGGASGRPSGGASGHPSGGASGHPAGGASVHPSGGASGHPSGGASSHPSGGAGDDDRRTNTTPEQVRPVINADDVVTTKFLQHVAQDIPHVLIKKICRMLGLKEKDIDDVEVLKHQDEQGFEFLKKLLGAVGKYLTYRSLLQALNKSKNKHYADNLIKDFHIEM